MLYEEINYTSPIDYLYNNMVYEYDISKANINVLYSKGIIEKSVYNELFNAPRLIRQKYVGNLQKRNSEVTEALKMGILEAKKNLFDANKIKNHEVLSIKNDAVFIINRPLLVTKFGIIEFLCKHQYTSFFRVKNLEMFYYYDKINEYETIDIKGINDTKLELHKDYFLQFLKDLFYTLQMDGVEIALRMLKDFYMDYITYNLDIEYYRTFNEDSIFHYKCNTVIGTGYSSIKALEENKQYLDISNNVSIMVELQKILMSIYFTKHK